MKNFSRVGTLMLFAFTFLFLFVACQPAADAPAPVAPPAAGADVPDIADVAAPGDVAAPAADAPADVDTVVIGMLAPLTGPAARFGTAVRDGAMLYLNSFNAQGGLQIDVRIFDEEGDLAQAVIGYDSLVDQGITALIGSVTSGPTMAVVPLAYDDGMPMITATSTHLNVTVEAGTGHVWSNVFRSCFIDPFQGTKMAEFVAEELGAQTAAVLYSNEIDYSIGLMEAFIIRAEELGIEIVAIERFAQDAIDFVGQLTNIAAVNPDVLFIPGYVNHVALIGPQSVAAGLDTILIGADGWDGVLAEMAEGQRHTLDGSFHMTGFSVEDESPMVQDFIGRFEAATGHPPDMFSAQAYDAAMILVAAIQLAIADGHYPNTREFKDSVIAHMAATNMTAVTGHITFDQYNNPQKTAVIVEFTDGEPRLWGTF